VPTESCAERSSLSRAVVDAVAETYRAKAAYEMAKRNRADNVDVRAGALQKARASERAAERALQEHFEQHGCKL
jgi:hypothetical protein